MSAKQNTPRPDCKVDGCDKPRRTLGFCGAHYARFHRWGDPLGSAPSRPTNEERFWRAVTKTAGCWEWGGSMYSNGYGHFRTFPGPRPRVGFSHMAHRFAYELLVGPIPGGLDLDHLCRNRRCVNPAHLEPVTRSENLRRGNTVPARAVAGEASRDGRGRFA